VDLAVSGHQEVIVEDDEGWVRGWWVPHEGEVAAFITPDEPLVPVPEDNRVAPPPGAPPREHLHARDWTFAAIAAECGRAHSVYGRRRTAQYQAYFAANPDLRGGHPLLACDLAAALPEGWDWIAELLPEQERHRWHLSGKSSQVLVLGVLGPAVKADPQLGWLEGLLGTPSPGPAPETAFEYSLAPEVLGEHPRVTAIDFFVDDPGFVLCAEAKWTESGMGRCSCRYCDGDPVTGECVQRVLDRSAYWQTAREVFGLPEREVGKPCPLSPMYQAVRNAAAALALADGRPAVFSLIYDAENPYFSGHEGWPGWPAVLTHALADAAPALSFTAVAWQELVRALPLDAAVRAWASEKHGLD
jgi:hypothetical protein